jgi:hypothetical protein
MLRALSLAAEEQRQAFLTIGSPLLQVIVTSDATCGRALVAAAPIGRGSWAVQVPGSLVITAEAAARQLALASLLPQHPLPAWSVLALWLSEARAAAHGHAWSPYVAVLPSSTGCVLEWTEAEASQTLDFTCLA